MRFIKDESFMEAVYHASVNHSTPSNLSYWWNFGSLALSVSILQIITGFFLACYYTPNIDFAFTSVEHIMRDITNGWIIRYTHANGASIFSITVYLHSLRGVYYGSYQFPRHSVRVVGVLIPLLMIVTAFPGYVLPWGQMSFRGATVITNSVSAVPFIGKQIVSWLWGGYSSNNASLTRFHALHFILPFIIIAFVIVHIPLLHQNGSNNPFRYFILCMILFILLPINLYKDIYGFLIYNYFICRFSFFLTSNSRSSG